MNCKPGDLAIIYRGSAFEKYWGQVVQCVELLSLSVWRIDRSLDGDPEFWILVPDSCLRPLPDSETEDETPTVRKLEVA